MTAEIQGPQGIGVICVNRIGMRGSSGVVLEGKIERLVLEPGDTLADPVVGEQGPYGSRMWAVCELRTLPPDKAWPRNGDLWDVTEAEMHFARVRCPYRSLVEARLNPPVFDDNGNLVAGGCLDKKATP